jgi:hypothetical protein
MLALLKNRTSGCIPVDDLSRVGVETQKSEKKRFFPISKEKEHQPLMSCPITLPG